MFSTVVSGSESAQVGDHGLAIAEAGSVVESGDYGISIVGPGGVAKSGEFGMLIFLDDHSGSRTVVVAYVGEDNIAPDQFYEFDGFEVVPSSYEI